MRVLLLNDTRREIGHIGCELVMRVIDTHMKGNDIDVSYSQDIGEQFCPEEFANEVSKVDKIIVNAEGTLHHNRGQGLLDRCKIAFDLQKEVHLINGVWQENDKFVEYLNGFSSIYLRESKSADAVKSAGFRVSAVVPDLSFFCAPQLEVTNEQVLGGVAVVVDSVLVDQSKLLAIHAARTKSPMYFMGSWHRKRFVKNNFSLYLKGLVSSRGRGGADSPVCTSTRLRACFDRAVSCCLLSFFEGVAVYRSSL
jgi:hypothetical protein